MSDRTTTTDPNLHSLPTTALARAAANPGPPRILLSAGEPSGDMHGAALASALLRAWPNAELFGLGGDAMAAAGVRLYAHTRQLAVMGFVEVLRHLPFFVRLWRDVKQVIADSQPDLVIPIDYPGFNMRLARHAKTNRIPVLYFIAPQVWAWHRSRMRQLAAHVDRLAVVLPFEEPLFREAGANVRFVGHPLSDVTDASPTRSAFCARLGLDPARYILALFPGSRGQEVERHLPLFQAATRSVQAHMPEVQPVLAASPAVSSRVYRASGMPFTGDANELLAHARAALVKSGTTTLQTGLAGVPMVVTYQMHPITYRLARTLVDVPHIALVNLVAGGRVVPELIQDAASPDALAQAVLPLLQDSAARETMRHALARVREKLAGPADGLSAADRVATLAAELIAAPRT
ncbi:MAG: lipid-A-disaccharide synthase [Longimicrobiales bacterium]